MQLPTRVIFDLDNTLGEAFHPPAQSMLTRFEELLARVPLAIMSAARLERIQRDVLDHFSPGVDLGRLDLFTANGAQAYFYKESEWRAQYQFGFTEEERSAIRAALEQCVLETGVLQDSKAYGEQFVDYEGYIAFTALGLGAPSTERKAWDPDVKKRHMLRDALQKKLPQFDVYIGGSTSVDITPKGINKAFAVDWYAKHLGIAPSEMLYIGDALYPAGNDEVVIATGIQTRSVADPTETEKVVDELLAN